MQIIKNHYNHSGEVLRFREIKREANEMLKFIAEQKFEGNWQSALALNHSEVNENPFAFFVVNKSLTSKVFQHYIIINPQIVNIPERIEVKNSEGRLVKVKNQIRIDEGCMSFPHRQAKKVDRYHSIKVKYQVPFFFDLFLRTIIEDCSGLKAHTFQHCIDHINGKNIYFNS